MKKIFAFILVLVIALSAAGCNIKKNDIDEKESSSVITTTEQVTLIYNHFKDRLPDFDFKKEVKETYRESLSYAFSVECSDKEFKKYVSALEDAGFNQNAVSAEGYYTASTEDAYFVEAALINGILNVNVKKI